MNENNNNENNNKKRHQNPIIYHGSIACQALKKSDNQACTNRAYFEEKGKYLCGQHSSSTSLTRKTLPIDKDVKKNKLLIIENHRESVEKASLSNKEQGIRGNIKCYKMRMMKDVPLIDGWKNIFPNNKHEHRIDGYGCSELSPMKLGPVLHRQTGFNIPLQSCNIENYHQSNKVYPNEVVQQEDEDEDKDEENNDINEYEILPIFFTRQQTFYEDEVPHRHKFDDKTMNDMRKKIPNQLNRNAPLFSVHQTLDGEERRFTYVQSRYFYCKAYERLAKETKAYTNLREMLINGGTNLIICGYDARDIEGQNMDTVYSDPRHAFGHELVLYSLLTIDNEEDYPWNRFRNANPEVYHNIAYML